VNSCCACAVNKGEKLVKKPNSSSRDNLILPNDIFVFNISQDGRRALEGQYADGRRLKSQSRFCSKPFQSIIRLSALIFRLDLPDIKKSSLLPKASGRHKDGVSFLGFCLNFRSGIRKRNELKETLTVPLWFLCESESKVELSPLLGVLLYENSLPSLDSACVERRNSC